MFETTSTLLIGDTAPNGGFSTHHYSPKGTLKRSPAAKSNRIPRREDNLGRYIAQLGDAELLNRDQERKLGKRIALLRKAFQRLVLKEAAVVEHILSWLLKYKAKQVRLDMLFEIPLKDKALRKKLEPRILANTEALKRLVRQTQKTDTSTDRYTQTALRRRLIVLCEELRIRSKYFEASPFRNPKAQQLLVAYRNTCRQLASANLRLVISIAKQYCQDSHLQMDLIQEGNRGLMRAVTKFDFRRNLRFSTYATPWIRKAMLETLPNQNRLIRIPDQFRAVNYRFQQKTQNGRADASAGSLEHQMSDELKIPYADASWRLCIQRDTQSLNQLADEAQGKQSIAGQLVDHRTINPVEAAEANELRSQIEESLRLLNDREQLVIRCRFGLDDGVSRSLAEVGRKTHFSRERVRQLEKSALAKLEELGSVTM